MVSAGSGFSGDENGKSAGKEAVEQAVEEVEDSPEIVYLFASSNYVQEEVVEGADKACDALIVGSSTAGEIHGTSSFTEHVVALAVGGEGVKAGSGVSTGVNENGFEAGRTAAEDLLEGLDNGYVPSVVASDSSGEWRSYPNILVTGIGSGLAGDNQEIMEGVNDVLDTYIGGGWAGDDWALNQTYVLKNGEVLEDSILLAGLDIDVRTGLGVRHGLDQEVDEAEVTSAEGNWVYELDGQKALDYYKEHFGAKAANSQFLLTKPLGIDTGEDEFRIREPLDVDEEEGSMMFSERIKEGWTVHIMDAHSEEVMEGAREAVDMALEKAGDPDDVEAVLVHDCACRWYFLDQSDKLEEELEVVKEKVGEDVPVVGWYTYGEIACPGSLAGVRHQNMVVQVITGEPLKQK